MFIQEYFTFSSRDLVIYATYWSRLLEKVQHLKIRNQFTVRSPHSNTLQQHANATNE